MDDRDLRAIEECKGLLDDVRGLLRLAAFEEEFSERAIYTHLAMQKVNHVDNLLKRVSETEEECHDRER